MRGVGEGGTQGEVTEVEVEGVNREERREMGVMKAMVEDCRSADSKEGRLNGMAFVDCLLSLSLSLRGLGVPVGSR